jgi:RNA polymerase sigma-70 factor (ECF subfamily)
MDYTQFDDKTLIALIARSNTDALSVLYDRYNRLVYSVVLHIVGDRETAEEITLDAFTRIWENADSYRADRAKVTTWLTSIARNRSIDELRRRGVRAEQHSVRWTDIPPDAEPRSNGLEARTELSLQREHVRAAVAELPKEQRRVLSLAYFGGYTQREIAEALQQPLGTVKTRIRLAMNRLRDALQDPGSG